MIDANEALRIGLANKVFSLGMLLEETIKFGRLILENGPNCVAKSLECINDSVGQSLAEGLDLELKAFSGLFETEETIFSDDVHFKDDNGYLILSKEIAKKLNQIFDN